MLDRDRANGADYGVFSNALPPDLDPRTYRAPGDQPAETRAIAETVRVTLAHVNHHDPDTAASPLRVVLVFGTSGHVVAGHELPFVDEPDALYSWPVGPAMLLPEPLAADRFWLAFVPITNSALPANTRNWLAMLQMAANAVTRCALAGVLIVEPNQGTVLDIGVLFNL